LGDLEKKDYAKISGALGIPESGVKEIADFIKNNLNPYPGAAFGGTACHIIPSFAVEETNNGYKFVNLENKYGPIINLSVHYLKMLEDPKTDAKTKEFLKEKVKRARDLIEDYKKRGETLEKIARKIIEGQKEFLSKGPIWLVPLSQKSLAEEFGLHASTISRTVASKFVQTPQGLFPLKYLCPRGPKGVTTARLKVMIKEIIDNENRAEALTDEQITKLINDRGIAIDRRTTAHYRKGLDIGTALDRTGS
jgi:RNA polymerase sigma-54 factor